MIHVCPECGAKGRVKMRWKQVCPVTGLPRLRLVMECTSCPTSTGTRDCVTLNGVPEKVKVVYRRTWLPDPAWQCCRIPVENPFSTAEQGP